MRLARGIVTLASWIAPADTRVEWRREWLAELTAAEAAGGSPLAFALGAPRHALALRLDASRPAALAVDLRFAWRLLRRRPGFALAGALTLAIGIGATTSVFSVVYAVLLQPLPYRHPAELVQLWERNPLFNWTEAEIAPANLMDWRDRNVVFSDIASYMGGGDRSANRIRLTMGGTEPSRVQALQVSANFFDVLGVAARIGRTFAPGEDVDGHQREIVVSDAFWHSHLGAREDAVGSTILLNGRECTVIGVMPAEFTFDQYDTDLWLPLVIADARSVRRAHLLRAVARLKSGVTTGQAQANLSAIAADLEREHPDTNRRMAVGVGPLDDWLVGQTRRPLLLFLAAVGLVLLIACANVANLMIVRSAERVRELSVRSALGASRARLIRQLLAESSAIAAAGTLAGVGVSVLALRLFVAWAPASLPRLNGVGLHPAVAVFAVALALASTLLVGIAPAMQAGRIDLRAALTEAGRGVSGRRRTTRLVIGVEVTLTVLLLVSASSTLRSFRALMRVDPGFRPQGLVTARIALPAIRYGAAGQASAFFEDLCAQLRSLPEIRNAGATMGLPVRGPAWTGDLYIESQPDVHGRELRHRSITSGYLETLGLQLIAGRSIQATDGSDRPLVVVVNETLARQYFSGRNPVGQRIAFDRPSSTVRWRTIVGVVSDEPQEGLGSPVAPQVYDAESQEEMAELAVMVRSDAPTGQVVDRLRDIVRRKDPQLALSDVAPLSDYIKGTLVRQQMAAGLAGAFALGALVLAAVGIYGVVAYAVTTRRREMGVRVACGATASQILRLVVGQHLRIVVAGVLAGLLGAIAAMRLVATTLYGVPATDVMSLGIGAGVIGIIAVAACTIPARRALRIDPVQVLRAE